MNTLKLVYIFFVFVVCSAQNSSRSRRKARSDEDSLQRGQSYNNEQQENATDVQFEDNEDSYTYYEPENEETEDGTDMKTYCGYTDPRLIPPEQLVKHGCSVVRDALIQLLNNFGEEITQVEILVCMFDVLQCLIDGDVVNIRNLPIKLPRVELEEYYGTCGQLVTFSSPDEIKLGLKSKNGEACSIIVNAESEKDWSYDLGIVATPLHHFRSCESEILLITEREVEQRYCGGIFSLTELPLGRNQINFTYVNYEEYADSITIRVRSTPRKSIRNLDRKRIIESTRVFPYDVARPLHGNVPNSEYSVQTFDPRFSDLQLCGFQCSTEIRSPLRGRSPLLTNKIPYLFDKADYPWIVKVHLYVTSRLLIDSEGIPIDFGGSVINSRAILTSASYLDKFKHRTTEIRVYGMPYNLAPHSWKQKKLYVVANDTIYYPDFKKIGSNPNKQMYEHDLAILILETPLGIGYYGVPVCFAPHFNLTGALVQTIQHLQYEENVTKVYESYSSVWSQKECRDRANVTDERLVFCHAYDDPLISVKETIGGPVMLRSRNVWFQVGVVSQVSSIEDGKVLQRISTNTYNYLEFIKSISPVGPNGFRYCH